VLDVDSDERLDRVYAAIPRAFGHVATLEAWLDSEPDQNRLTVRLGEHQVGTLDKSTAAAYRPIMHAAAQRDEMPYATARLTPRPATGGYLLELQLRATVAPR
jgi:hypothetical protein